MTDIAPIAAPALPRTADDSPTGAPAPSSFREALREVATDLARGESILASSLDRRSGAPPLDTQQLLALQAGVYQYTQQVDLVSRLVDRAAQAVKSTLQSQS